MRRVNTKSKAMEWDDIAQRMKKGEDGRMECVNVT